MLLIYFLIVSNNIKINFVFQLNNNINLFYKNLICNISISFATQTINVCNNYIPIQRYKLFLLCCYAFNNKELMIFFLEILTAIKRWRPELNRRKRICSPLPDHSATPPLTVYKYVLYCI